MLRNNADARQSSYFELELPVISLIVAATHISERATAMYSSHGDFSRVSWYLHRISCES